MTASTPSERPRSATIAYRSALVVIGVVALVVRLWSPGPTTEIYDENLWLQRSDNFSRSIADGRPGDASAALPSQHLQNPTMPGVTTMWAGVAGRQVARLSGALGLSEPIRGPSGDSPQVLRASQGVVSVVCVATLLVLLVLLERLFDRRTSLITGALFATAPWIAAYGNLLHTDAMVTLFAVVAVCALRWGLHGERGAPPAEPDEAPRTVGIMVSGVFAALAMLTKANAVGILAPGFTLLVWSAWRADRARLAHGRCGDGDLGRGHGTGQRGALAGPARLAAAPGRRGAAGVVPGGARARPLLRWSRPPGVRPRVLRRHAGVPPGALGARDVRTRRDDRVRRAGAERAAASIRPGGP
jgi:hypothetical protein